MAKKSKVVAATGTTVGFMHAGDAAKRIEAAMVKAIEDTPRKSGEKQEDHDKRVRAAIRKARDAAIGG